MTDATLVLRRHPGFMLGLLLAAAAAFGLAHLQDRLASGTFLRFLLVPEDGRMDQIVFHYSWLPRLTVAVMCGAALSLAGALFQQVLRNPLASPSTLGVSAGAQLALALAGIAAPGLLDAGREWVAMAGGAAAMIIVVRLSWRSGLSPISLILAGMVVSLYAGSAAALLVIFNHDYLTGLFIWGGGSLSQQDWSTVEYLAPRLAAAALPIPFLIRPLTVLELSDDGARGLGVSLMASRLTALALAVALSGLVVAAVGVIGFIGLAGPVLARLAGARRFRDRLIWAPLFGAALLLLTDLAVQYAAGRNGELLPTGAFTALFGAPLLLAFLPHLKVHAAPPKAAGEAAPLGLGQPWGLIAVLGGAAALILAIALTVGRGPYGWQWSDWGLIENLAPWRAPRAFAALAAGALLALAGAILQRLTGNAMASPEILGINAGAALGLLVLLFVIPAPGRPVQMAAGAIGAGVALGAILLLSWKSAFSPERIVLAGFTFAACFDAAVVALTASGDPRAARLLTWMTGSTYRITADDALIAGGTALLLGGMALACRRWLDILPLGGQTAQALGVPLDRSRLVLLLLTAMMAATATLMTGPLGFIGLMAPHLARLLGLHRALPQLIGAALLGAAIMCGADWLGRFLLFPREIPAGLMATFLGAPLVLWRLQRL